MEEDITQSPSQSPPPKQEVEQQQPALQLVKDKGGCGWGGWGLPRFAMSFFFLIGSFEVSIGVVDTSKPDPKDGVATARWLASQYNWGIISIELGGAPFGNVISFNDGLPDKGCGIPYFYLTTLDPTARNALKDERASLTLSESPIGSCGKADPENPTCAKLYPTGKIVRPSGSR